MMLGSQKNDSNAQLLLEENKRLRRAVEELSILNDLAREIGASLNLQEIMKKIISRSLRAVRAEQGTITLVEPKKSDSMKTLVRSMLSSSQRQPFHLDQALLGWMHLNKQPLHINDPQHDDRFKGVKWHASIRSLLCVPLLIKSELRGILTVYNKKEGLFTEEDNRLLAIISAQSAQVLENARLYEEEQALIRMQEEFRLASEIQMGLLPKTAPQIAGYDIAGRSIPAQLVGGDYFDFIPIDAARIALCVGDISGKGLPAALLMASLQATIRGQCLANPSAGECLKQANRLLHMSTSPQKFATLFYSILHTEKNQLHYSNAGHNWPIFFAQNKGPIPLKTGGIALSFLEASTYKEDVIDFLPGDVLVIYSDGVTEAMNEADEEFDEDKLAKLIGDYAHFTASELIEMIIKAVKDHTGSRPQLDDITLLVVKRVS